MPKVEKTNRKIFFVLLSIPVSILITACASIKEGKRNGYLNIQEQGSFAVGGIVITNPGTFDPSKPTSAGQTFRGDHACVFYQIPVKARKHPLVMWHGIGMVEM